MGPRQLHERRCYIADVVAMLAVVEIDVLHSGDFGARSIGGKQMRAERQMEGQNSRQARRSGYLLPAASLVGENAEVVFR
jgi:hypothetical protein